MTIFPFSQPWGQRKPDYGTQINPSHPLSEGLESAWLLNEGAGKIIYDVTGFGNNGGFINGGPAWVTGPYGPLLNFNGSIQYIQTGSSQLNFGINQSLSVSAWINFTANQSNYTGLVCKATPIFPGWAGFQFLLYGNAIAVECEGATGADVGPPQGFVGTTALNDGKWHHCVATIDKINGIGKLYVDGVLQTSITNSNLNQDFSSTADLLIGTERTAALFFDGKLDAPMVWGRVLSPGEVQKLYSDPFCFMQQRKLWIPIGTGVTPPSQIWGFAGAGGIQGTGQIGIAS